MKKSYLLIILILTLCLSAFAQEIKKEKLQETASVKLAPDESKQLKNAFDLAQQAESEAKAAQDRLAARQAEAKALYFQYVVVKKIDIDKWQFAGFDKDGIANWVEKKEETKKEGKADGNNSKSN